MSIPVEQVSPFERRLAFDINEVSSVTTLGRTSVYAAIKEGRLKARKYGRRTIILVDDLQAFLTSLASQEIAGETA